MQGLQAKINQQTINQVKAQWSNFVDELNKKSNVDINANTTQLQNKLSIAVKNIDEALKEFSKFGEVTAKNLVFDDKGQLTKFNIELERTKGIIETIKYSADQIDIGNGQMKNVFTVDVVNVLNKQKQLINQKTEAQLKEEESNKRLIEQENIKLKTIQLQWEQKVKNLQTTAKELNDAELYNKIYNFQNSINSKVSTGAVGQQELKNEYQDIINYQNQLIAKNKEMQQSIKDTFNTYAQEQDRVAKLGEFKTSFDPSLFEKSNQEIKKYIQNIYGADAKVVKFSKTLDGYGDSIIKATVNTKNSKNEIQQESIVLDKNTNSVYKNGEAIKANTSRMVGFVDRLKNAWVAVTS